MESHSREGKLNAGDIACRCSSVFLGMVGKNYNAADRMDFLCCCGDCSGVGGS